MTKINGMNYDELSEHITRAIEELQYKAYEEGYKQGKFDVRMEGIFGKVHEETPQQKRDRIVEQAKADVSKLEGLYLDDYHYGDYVVNRKKRTIVALIKPIKDLVNQKIYKGIAKCQPSDCFNVHIGKAIALRRALGLYVPIEYLYTPQPTEVRVGDVIYDEHYQMSGKVYAINPEYRTYGRDVGWYFGKKPGYITYIDPSDYERRIELKFVKIIDDSRENDESPNRKPRVGDLIEVRMPSGKTEQLRIVDKNISEIGEDECSLYSAAVTRGRIVEEGE